MKGREDSMSSSLPSAIPSRCRSLYLSLLECQKRVKDPIQKEAFCRHLNRSLASCLVSEACPDAWDAVQCMCSSSGTSAKRAQCQEAKLRLSTCLSSLQVQSD